MGTSRSNIPARKMERRTGKSALVVAITLLLVSLSCALPTLNLPQIKAISPSPTQAAAQPTAVPLPTQAPPGQVKSLPPTAAVPADEQPPVLVEVQPPAGSELPAPASLTFYFSTPMDPESVQRGAEFQPAVDAGFEWTDPATVRVTLAKPLPPRADLSITFNNNVKSKAGKFVTEPVTVHYSAPPALQTLERLPKPDTAAVDPSAAVAATFSRPVVPLVGEVTSLPPGFTLEPAAEGRGEWLNTSTYIFYPRPALAGGKQYQVKMNAGLGLDPAQGWAFTTAVPSVVKVEPDQVMPIRLDAPIVLTFNQPMDAASVQENFIFQNEEEARVAGKFSWDQDFTRVTFQPEPILARDTQYTLTLAQNAHSQGGTLLEKKITAQFRTVPALAVLGIKSSGEPVQVYEGYASLQVAFTAPLAQQDLSELITFSPPVPGFNTYLPPEGDVLTLSGFMQPSTLYTLTLSPGIKDRWGQPLGNPAELSFTTSHPAPTFRIPMLQLGAPVLFTPSSVTTLSARAANIKTLDILSSNLNLPDFFATNQGQLSDYQPAQRSTWQQSLDLPENSSQPVAVNLTDTGSPLTPGLYYYSITSPQISEPAANGVPPFVLVVSDIHILMKRSASEVFLWAYDLARQENAARLAVSLYDEKGNAVGNLVTDEQGAAKADLPAGLDPYTRLVAVSGKPGEANFSLGSTMWNQGITSWEFGLPPDYRGNEPQVYLYTDRPIYRPGQKVYFRGIARAQKNGRYSLLDQDQIPVQVMGSSDFGQPPTLFDQDLTLDTYGAFSGEVDLPRDAQPGYYTIMAGQPNPAQLSFQVAEYRKPEIELRVQFPTAEIQAGQDLQASLNANYYFGAPAGRLAVNWTLSITPGYFSLPEGFQAGKPDLGWLIPISMREMGVKIVAQGDAQTAPDGTLSIAISADTLKSKLDFEATYNLVLEVTAQDESGQPVSSRARITMHPAAFYAGVRPDSWSAKAGEAMGFDVQTVDWQRNPSGEHALRAVFQRVVWKVQQSPNAYGYQEQVPEYTEIGSVDFRTDAGGRARLSFSPDQPGTFLLRVSGEGAVTELLIWAGGQGSAPWPQLGNQQLKLVADASSYKPGDTAKILIPNPFPDGAQALITVERGEVMRWQVLQLQGASATFDVPLKDEDAPNIYLSVTLLNPRSDSGLDFRQGYLSLDVDPAAETLQVQVAASPEKAAPGQEVNLAVRASDSQGKPVAGEFSLALIDKAVLALADPNSPKIEQAFYGRQPLGVQTSLSTAAFVGRIPLSPPGGRGGGPGEVSPSVREQFADTAYWNAQVTTDQNGSAVVTAKLPDNLTTWVLDARGVTEDTKVGGGTAELVTTKDLLIRPALPRFVVAGDRVELAAVVNNNTSAALQVDVSLEAEGVTLEQPGQAAQRVEIPANDRRRVAWMASVQSVEKVNLLFRARSGQLEDTVRPEQGALPVLSYTAPDTFGTAGTLSEAGQRTEWVSLPRSFQPQGGAFRLELTPSLGAAVISGLKTLDTYSTDFSETALSRLLANLEAFQALQKLGVNAPDLKTSLDQAVQEDLRTLARLQNEDGSWGWLSGSTPDPYISAYILFGLTRVQAAGIDLPPDMLQKALSYVSSIEALPAPGLETWQLDRLLFQAFALQQAGYPVNLDAWYGVTEQLSPWSNALLAVLLNQANPDDSRAREILSRLEIGAERSATGARWSGSGAQFRNYATPAFSTAAVVYALAKLDPASPLLVDGVRYLVSIRQNNGGWYSSYDTAWSLIALVEALQGTGDLQARYNYTAALNGTQIASGSVEGTGNLTPVQVDVPLEQLNDQAANPLQISRDAGSGRLYYRAYLSVNRPVKDAPPVDRGLSISRSYTLAGQNCRQQACSSLNEVKLASPAPVVEVRLSMTVPADLTNVVVEDTIPAGTEILNATLKTSQQQGIPESKFEPEIDPRDPFAGGWGWWRFHDPRIYDTHIRWFADELPAGTYQLTYRLVVQQIGEYQVLPARAYAYYFPEIQGSSAGEVFKIQP